MVKGSGTLLPHTIHCVAEAGAVYGAGAVVHLQRVCAMSYTSDFGGIVVYASDLETIAPFNNFTASILNNMFRQSIMKCEDVTLSPGYACRIQ